MTVLLITFFTPGGSTWRTGWSDHKSSRCPPKIFTMGLRGSLHASPRRSPGFNGAAEMSFVGAAGHGAPSAIQRRSTAMSLLVSFSLGGISNSGLACITAWSSRLSEGFPGMTAGPLSPPFTVAARESRRSAPFTLSGPWQLMQRESSNGLTLSWKCRCAASSARAAPAPAMARAPRSERTGNMWK